MENFNFQKGSPIINSDNKISRNDLCFCGSGLKHKKCCMVKKAVESVKMEVESQKRISIPKSLKAEIESVEKLKAVLKKFNDDQQFMEQFFYPIWNSHGNRHMANFEQVWEFTSKLKVKPTYAIWTLENKGELVPLFRCMTVEEYDQMCRTNLIVSPSWTDQYNLVTHFKNHQIQTGVTEKNLIVMSLFNVEDVLSNFELEGEHFLKRGTVPMATELIFDWTVQDVEQTYGHPMEKLYITHEQNNNGFSDSIDTLISNGLELENWYKVGEVWYSSNGTDKKYDGYFKISEIISEWETQFCQFNGVA
ncbi:SEC-C domain-containing protein [Flavobacterium sp.]|uniref:SEC-C domain-containing protein n=1 Tax=Flavobacterium sp. TaxID=239 RepID=UPI0025FC9AF2|nr:SEC-C domain-containing protein [Flavobacterium sp.]